MEDEDERIYVYGVGVTAVWFKLTSLGKPKKKWKQKKKQFELASPPSSFCCTYP